MNWYDQEKEIAAFDAISKAQKIAYAPMLFQGARLLCKLGILETISGAGSEGISSTEIASANDISKYGVDVLLSMGLSAELVCVKNQKFTITKIGHFLLNDAMARVNMDFTHDVCYQGMFYLEQAIKEGKPAGLKVFGEWENIYQGLSELPEKTQSSWYNFDHYYSQGAFSEALIEVFATNPKTLLDVGGNTGKWALACADYDENVHVIIVDLPEQLEVASANIHKAGVADRVFCHGVNILRDPLLLPDKVDTVWMSQFLDCFSEEQIVSILKRTMKTMHKSSRLFIMETLWDCQQYEAAAYSLNATSLYFTAMANGNSRMYSSKKLSELVSASGLRIEQRQDNVGFCHSLLKCCLA